jgi:hypothetical protein
MKKVDIGFGSAGAYFIKQVMPANTRFLEISSRENAIDLAKALWDTAGWLWSDRNPGVDRRAPAAKTRAFDEDLFRRCPDLQLIRDLAEFAKHGGELNRASVVVKGISGIGSQGGTSFVSNPFGANGERSNGPFGGMAVQSTPKCTLQIDTANGSRNMKDALASVFHFLQTEITKP